MDNKKDKWGFIRDKWGINRLANNLYYEDSLKDKYKTLYVLDSYYTKNVSVSICVGIIVYCINELHSRNGETMYDVRQRYIDKWTFDKYKIPKEFRDYMLKYDNNEYNKKLIKLYEYNELYEKLNTLERLHSLVPFENYISSTKIGKDIDEFIDTKFNYMLEKERKTLGRYYFG